MVAVSRVLVWKQMELLRIGDVMGAETAFACGLVNWMWQEAEVERAIGKLVGGIAEARPALMALGEALFCRQWELPVTDVSPEMSEVMRQ